MNAIQSEFSLFSALQTRNQEEHQQPRIQAAFKNYEKMLESFSQSSRSENSWEKWSDLNQFLGLLDTKTSVPLFDTEEKAQNFLSAFWRINGNDYPLIQVGGHLRTAFDELNCLGWIVSYYCGALDPSYRQPGLWMHSFLEALGRGIIPQKDLESFATYLSPQDYEKFLANCETFPLRGAF
ncbi:MAG: hypothetical protein ACD_17C00312G0004 [uncultured bacterium]|nr:MAG: hypothetical protein ACD_17C00312G0004 [uncultured bacterium]OGN55473.1 MAG: hypothetical protein A2796_00195 [Chlamydiae bacterium RIFCSPHIGHO2_01_FULL_44_39]OGN58459.1 MAG: hypothetical protein A3C42_03350 [Chlamydiae bacterium RIFCSPHIGHO2_02_FULL_45_9]OGN59976.1 MAG: hypothetical protein A3D96_00750 [Chlamydiae bacterium RIFCSPHIGHO2_12_FULL_44_59]OGN66191.1 MAG: hypothetical protein A2978_06075 [Chlamydiae bacterium RIFCSPLOWO2_01_FULL_44_52]OGN69095.1 MAG: hypothetical protein A3